MKWIKSKQIHQCVVCKKPIRDDICIRSHKGRCFYHEKCHYDRFGENWMQKPTNKKPE